MTAPALAVARRYVEVGQPERALETLAGLDAETARSTEAVALRGFAHYGADQMEAAADVARDGLADAPQDQSLLLLLSLSEERLGHLPEAEAAVLAALELSPEDPQLLCQYADVLMQGQELGKAERLLDMAAALDPDSPDVLQSRIHLAYLRHDRRQAEALSRELLSRDPESLQAHRMLGAVALEQGKAAVAAKRFGEAARQAPHVEDSAELARQSTALDRPRYWPLVFFGRFGPGPTWVGAMALIFGARAAGLDVLAGVLGLTWFVLCVWSWVAAARLKRVLSA